MFRFAENPILKDSSAKTGRESTLPLLQERQDWKNPASKQDAHQKQSWHITKVAFRWSTFFSKTCAALLIGEIVCRMDTLEYRF
jgi:hypothetical protein